MSSIHLGYPKLEKIVWYNNTLCYLSVYQHGLSFCKEYLYCKPPFNFLCLMFTGGTTRAQWEDVTGSTPLTFVNDCVNFTTTVSARFWLMDCRNIEEATKMATELYREAIHAPFMAKYVVIGLINIFMSLIFLIV